MNRRCQECVLLEKCTLDKEASVCKQFTLNTDSPLESYTVRSSIQILDGVNPNTGEEEAVVVTNVNSTKDYVQYPKGTKFVLMPIRGSIKEEEVDSKESC